MDIFIKQTLATVIETARLQHEWCKDSGVEVFTESDTYPRDRFHTPAAYFNINPDEIFDAEVVFSNKIKKAEFINCQGRIVSDYKAVIDYVKPFGFAAVIAEMA